MKFIPLLWSLLSQNRARTVLMSLSIATAFLLFGLVQAGISAVDAGVRLAGADRLIVTASAGLSKPLPYAHRALIEQVPGVAAVTPWVWFGASYRDPRNAVLSFAVDPGTLFDVDPSLRMPEDQRQAFVSTRTGAVAGVDLATRQGWKIGDRIPLRSPWRNAEGSESWEFELVGLYSLDEQALGQPMPAMHFFFQYDYFAAGQARGPVSWYGVRVASEQMTTDVSKAIDRAFLNSSNETYTQSERDFSTGILRQLGDVGAIGLSIMGATLSALMIAIGNSMMRTYRERVPQFAVLKTLGFTDAKICLLGISEAVILCLGSALAGLGVALWLVPIARQGLAQVLPGLNLGWPDLLVALGCAGVLAVLSAAVPVWRSSRLTIVQALAES